MSPGPRTTPKKTGRTAKRPDVAGRSHIRQIEIRTRRLVNTLFSGDYKSSFKGRGIEFLDVREYQPGDDVRTIDWEVTARFGRPYVKKYAEERELVVILLVDASGSDRFGTKRLFKLEQAAQVTF